MELIIDGLLTSTNIAITIIFVFLPLIILIALIISIFYIANRQSRQDKGQDIIINLLKEIRDNQIELLEESNDNTRIITEELEVTNRNIYKLCELVSGQEQENYDEEYYEDKYL